MLLLQNLLRETPTTNDNGTAIKGLTHVPLGMLRKRFQLYSTQLETSYYMSWRAKQIGSGRAQQHGTQESAWCKRGGHPRNVMEHEHPWVLLLYMHNLAKAPELLECAPFCYYCDREWVSQQIVFHDATLIIKSKIRDTKICFVASGLTTSKL